jgi:hypothetical protein
VSQPQAQPDHQNATAGRWLTPGVGGIGAASLLADLGHEIPSALLPSLLTSTLGAPAAALGAIEGVADGLAGAARRGGLLRETVAVLEAGTRLPTSEEFMRLAAGVGLTPRRLAVLLRPVVRHQASGIRAFGELSVGPVGD